MISVYKDLESLSRAAAEHFITQAWESVNAHGRFTVALSGGNTPRRMYELLAQPAFQERTPWDKTHVFWGDERCVPPQDERSNQRMAHLSLLNHVPIPSDQIHPISGTREPSLAALEYQELLQVFFAEKPPVFDLILLGLGENGHTASLFPETPVLDEKCCWASDVYLPKQNMYRVTLTAPVINQAALILFLVSGSEKALVLHEIIEGPADPHRLPAQLIQPVEGKLLWLVDHDASHLVSRKEFID